MTPYAALTASRPEKSPITALAWRLYRFILGDSGPTAPGALVFPAAWPMIAEKGEAFDA